MSRRFRVGVLGVCLLTTAWHLLLPIPGVCADQGQANHAKDATDNPPVTVAEARGRARLLHETIHGALQVMHRDFFDKDDRRRIPSKSLEDVFSELALSDSVQIRWLAVNAKTMSEDHAPQDAFEKRAVEALSSGEEEYEAVENDRYRRAGAIRLHNVCLKCHVPNRTSLEDRAAGLVISMPIQEE